MPSNDAELARKFAETRLRQVARLAALHQKYADSLNGFGRAVINRSMMAMVRDCCAAGIDEDRVAAALQQPDRESHHSDAVDITSPPHHAPPCFTDVPPRNLTTRNARIQANRGGTASSRFLALRTEPLSSGHYGRSSIPLRAHRERQYPASVHDRSTSDL